MIVTGGSDNVSVPFYFVDDVGGTSPGEPTTGLLFSDIETGGSASYQRQGAARVDITAITLASAAAAHADGGFLLVDDTEMPGVYRFDVPNLAVATGVDFVIVYLRAASGKNTITRPLKIDLTAVPTDIAAVKAETALIVSDTNELQTDNVPGLISTLDTDVAADVAAVKAETALIVADTNELQVDNIPGLISTLDTDVAADVAAVKAETALIVADTNELQTDDVPALIAAVQADLPVAITKNVALANFPFLMVDSADSITPKTGLTVTVERSIDGAAYGASTNTPATEVGSGSYKISLSASDLNGDTISLKFTATGADARYITIVTQAT